MHGYARICPIDHRGRVEMTLWSRALPPPRHFDSQIKGSSNSFRRRHSSEVTLSLYEHPRRPSTSEILTIFGPRSSKLEKLFLTGFFGRHFEKPAWLKIFRNWKIKLSLWLKMVHVGIQVKDSSNSLRRRHSSEGVDAKFGSTLPNFTNFTKR